MPKLYYVRALGLCRDPNSGTIFFPGNQLSRKMSGRIVGGTSAVPHSMPWQIFIRILKQYRLWQLFTPPSPPAGSGDVTTEVQLPAGAPLLSIAYLTFSSMELFQATVNEDCRVTQSFLRNRNLTCKFRVEPYYVVWVLFQNKLFH